MRSPDRSVTSWWTAEPQGQGQAALLALGGLEPGVPPVEPSRQVVAVGPDRGHRPPEVVGPRGPTRAAAESPAHDRRYVTANAW